ncbi:MAG: disulfide bond formation protein B, partial [Gammaproteobacteria bacterium]
MMNSILVKKIEYVLNMLAVLGISTIFIISFILQFGFHELPCPLCLLQRVGFTLMAMGFLFNIRFGLRPSHYAIVLLSAVYTAFVAARQVLLHIIPGTGDYGPPIFGLHMYTWTFILSVIIIIVTTLMLGVDRQYEPAHINNTKYKKYA